MPDASGAPTKSISQRKSEHIALCETDEVAFRAKTNLLEQVQLVHDALPEMAVSDVNLSVEYAGRTLAAPILIAAMTGGTQEAHDINRDLARVAQEFGVGFGFGSQRPLLTEGIRAGYEVRDVAPDALVLGNIGIVQATRATTAQLREMLDICGADALCVHLNPAMELVQPEGDDDFRGGLKTLSRLVQELDRPVVVKETGCGLSRSVGARVRALGVQWVDTSGAGGTSWVGVEALRAKGEQAALGERFWDWGIPTAGSVVQLSDLDLGICATGGVQTGLDIAHAIALGATCGGLARPLLQARAQGGLDAVRARMQRLIEELRVAHLLAGARTPAQLRRKPVLIGPALARWVPRGVGLRERMLA